MIRIVPCPPARRDAVVSSMPDVQALDLSSLTPDELAGRARAGNKAAQIMLDIAGGGK